MQQNKLVEIRPAQVADIASAWQVRTAAVRLGCASHYTAQEIAVWSASPPSARYPGLFSDGCAVVAQHAGGMLGYAVIDVAAAEVDAIFVSPAHGGRGIGKQLLSALEAIAATHGLARLQLNAALNAVPFYQAYGYLALRSERYPHPSGISLASVYMEKPLNEK